MTRWQWRERRGSTTELHEIVPPESEVPTVWVQLVEDAALVLGSAQPADDVDDERLVGLGLSRVRRRSGGGAVLLVPGEHVWIDIWVPSASRLWESDVVRATDWLADVWLRAFEALGQSDLVVHRSSSVPGRWSRQVCFAGIGPGEITARGQKLLGMSQRRNRDWTRFQCLVHRRWDAALTFGALRDPDAAAAIEPWHDAVGVVADADLVAAFAAALEPR